MLATAGCKSAADKQWYKPGIAYTVAEFQRDEAECTKNRVLDEECLKQRGWVPLTSFSTEVEKPVSSGPSLLGPDQGGSGSK